MSKLEAMIRWHVQKPLLHAVLRPQIQHEQEVFADAIMPLGTLGPASICYCGGVGEDIRFEQALIARFGAQVWAFDPTPRSVKYIERMQPLPASFHFVPFGLWSEDTTLTFYAPANPDHVSHSVEGPQGGSSSFQAPCRSVVSLMREFGHQRLDLLKMNIEGAEDRVLGTVLDAGITPKIITLTYEGRGAFRKALRWTKRLNAAGYQLLGIRGWFVTYVLRSDREGQMATSQTATSKHA